MRQYLTVTLVATLALSVTDIAHAQKKNKKENDGGTTVTDTKTGAKTKQYTFGGLDIDGKLKTPQLMYFLNRMKSEFDTTTPDKRSFIPELKRSTDEM